MTRIPGRDRRVRPDSGRWSVVALIVTVAGVGTALLVLALSVVLRLDVEDQVRAAVAQEVEEVRRFSETGVDPATGRAFTSGSRFAETYVQRQRMKQDEILLGGPAGGEATAEVRGAGAPPVSDLTAATRERVLAPGTHGTVTDDLHGGVSWASVPVELAEDAGAVTVLVLHQHEQEEMRDRLVVLGLLSLASLLATGVAAWFAAGPLLAHVADVEREARRAARSPDVPRLPESGRAEYVRLARAVNGLLARAETAVDRERVFVEDASHALRTPLALVEAGVTDAAEAPLPPGHARELAEETRRLRRLVEDLSLLHRLDRGEGVRPDEEVTVGETLRHAAELWEASGGRPVDIDAGAVAGRGVRVDPPRLARVLAELLANADHAQDGSGPLTLRACPVQEGEQDAASPGDALGVTDEAPHGAVVLEVLDRGRGVPEGEEDDVLHRFAHASNDPAPGSGLGLSVVRRVLAAHRGYLTLTPRADGPGMRAGAVLPLAPEES